MIVQRSADSSCITAFDRGCSKSSPPTKAMARWAPNWARQVRHYSCPMLWPFVALVTLCKPVLHFSMGLCVHRSVCFLSSVARPVPHMIAGRLSCFPSPQPLGRGSHLGRAPSLRARMFPNPVWFPPLPEGCALPTSFGPRWRIPKGFDPSAQGCEERATLGWSLRDASTLKGLQRADRPPEQGAATLSGLVGAAGAFPRVGPPAPFSPGGPTLG